MRWAVGVMVAAAVVVAAGCVFCGSDWGRHRITSVSETPLSLSPTEEPLVVGKVGREPSGRFGAETEALLETTIVPTADLRELAIRLRGLSPDVPRIVNPDGAPDYPVGARRLFHALGDSQQFDVEAILVYKTEHVYMWVEEGISVDLQAIAAAADLFEAQTYPTTRFFFGSEWSPGVDNDPHLSILHVRGLGGSTLGYYYPTDEFVAAVRANSNEMEMFYVSAGLPVGSSLYHGVLAHEFQHMIHWNNDRDEENWLDEGCSELSAHLNGFDSGGSDGWFAAAPDTQLNDWPEGSGATGNHYGASYLFMAYFLERFGPQAVRMLATHPENAFSSVDAVLDDLDAGMTHADLFGDWVIANLLDNPAVADGRYGYRELDPLLFSIDAAYHEGEAPISRTTSVRQYGTDYVELRGKQPFRFRFTGSTQVELVGTAAHSGRYAWWSNRGDDSNTMLTRLFDLSAVGQATLTYWVWYDIEEDWDYAYVEASADGVVWDILPVPSGRDTNPYGSSFGRAYTGRSGGASGGRWIHEQVDLSPYAGREVWVRFEYVTDAAVYRPGLVLDDVAIPEIGYFSDFEEDGGGWEPAGFVRHANVLPQRWLVQLVSFGPQVTVQRLALDERQAGEWVIPLNTATDRAVIAISALAPVTTEVAWYGYEIRALEEGLCCRNALVTSWGVFPGMMGVEKADR